MKTHRFSLTAPLLTVLAFLMVGCSKEVPKDLLDRSHVLEIAFAEQTESAIPHGKGAYSLKKEMHRNGGWANHGSRFFVMYYRGPFEEPLQNSGSLQAYEAWMSSDMEREVRIWLDGGTIGYGGWGPPPGGTCAAKEIMEVVGGASIVYYTDTDTDSNSNSNSGKE